MRREDAGVLGEERLQSSAPIAEGASRRVVRAKIAALQTAIEDKPDALGADPFPIKHSFAEGLYIRELTVPADTLTVTKIHKYSHVTVLMRGTIYVVEETMIRKLEAPAIFITQAGTKRAIYHKTEVVISTIHGNPDNEEDVEKIESRIIAKTFKEIEKGGDL